MKYIFYKGKDWKATCIQPEPLTEEDIAEWMEITGADRYEVE